MSMLVRFLVALGVFFAANLAHAIATPTGFKANEPVNDGSYTLSWNAVTTTKDGDPLGEPITYYKLKGTAGNGTTTTRTTSGRSYASSSLPAAFRAFGSHTFTVEACDGNDACSENPTLPLTVIVRPILRASDTVTPSATSTNVNSNYSVSWHSKFVRPDFVLLERYDDGGWRAVKNNAASITLNHQASGHYTYKLVNQQLITVGALTVPIYTDESAASQVAIRPPVPAGFTASNTNQPGEVRFDWSPVSDEAFDLYQLYRLDNGSSNVWVGNVAVSDTSHVTTFTLPDLAAGTYSYRVRSRTNDSQGNINSSWSSVLNVIVPGAPGLSVPGGTDTDGIFPINWISNDPSIIRFILQDSSDNGVTWNTLYSGSNHTFTPTQYVRSGHYQYRILACSAQACGPYSTPEIQVVDIPVPSAPVAVSVPESDFDGQFNVAWEAVSGVDVSYQVQYTLGDGIWVDESGLTDAAALAMIAQESGAYVFRVRACNSSGCSAYATSTTTHVTVEASVNTPAAPAPMGSVSQAAIDQSSQVGAIQGSFRVSESGAATYSIPVFAPQGTAGVMPQISLNYSSQGGNGLVGKGWSLGGLTSISRCRQTLGQDGVAKPITLTNEDRLCLDGQRLISINGSSSAAYWAANAEYRTEIDSQAIVKRQGEAFVVTRKDGSISTYGGTANSRLQLSWVAIPFMWSINRFEDSVGNPITFSYLSDSDGHRIDRIDYAYGSNRSGETSSTYLKFSYGQRGNLSDKLDNHKTFVAGWAINLNKRLTRIEAVSGGQSVRLYNLEYHQNTQNEYNLVSRLTSIEECVYDQCLPKTSFDWLVPDEASTQTQTITLYGREVAYDTTINEYGFESSSYDITLEGSADRVVSDFQMADINGDGLADIVWTEPDYDNDGKIHDSFAKYALSNGSGFDTPVTFYSDSANHYTHYKLQVLDYNADGRADILLKRQKHDDQLIFISSMSAANRWALSSANTVNLGVLPDDTLISDHNSDGLGDLVYLEGEAFTRRLLERNPSQSTSSGRFYRFGAEESLPLWDGGNFLPSPVINPNSLGADFNGDGRSDFLVSAVWSAPEYSLGGWIHLPYISTDQGLEYYAEGEGSQSLDLSNAREVKTPDFNQDGLSDLLFLADNRRWYFQLNTGAGFQPAQEIMQLDEDSYTTVKLLDYNQDGSPDLVWHDVPAKTLRVKLWQSDSRSYGDDIATETILGNFGDDISIKTTSGNKNHSFFFGDMNGDGVADLMQFHGSTLSIFKNHKAHMPRFVISDIRNGLGAETSITYAAMSTGGHYTRADKLIDVTSPETYCNETMPNADQYALAWCIYTSEGQVDTGDFYSSLNGNWQVLPGSHRLNKTEPVLELMAPTPLVARVRSSAPSFTGGGNFKAAISYYYAEAKIQAGGRGLLGFKQLRTVDEQSGIQTTTTYRQDFPFTGYPETTVVKSGNRELSRSENVWQLYGWNGQGTSAPYRPYIRTSTERTSDLETGELLSQVITTNTQNDEWGNVRSIDTQTLNGNGTESYRKLVNNTYYPDTWSLQHGRLRSTTVEHFRPGYAEPITRSSDFEYYDQYSSWPGLLAKETIAAGTDDALETRYEYDGFGNPNRMELTGIADTQGTTSTRITQWDFDTSGRFLSKETQFVTSAGGVRTLEVMAVDDSLLGARDALGQPRIISDINGVRTYKNYDAFGRVYQQYHETGDTVTTLLQPSHPECLEGAAFAVVTHKSSGGETVVCHDILGRPFFEIMQGFSSSERIYKGTAFDDVGRVVFTTLPFFAGDVPAGATSYSYDLLGRNTQITQPDAETVSIDYQGLKVITTNPLGQQHTEMKNVLGELVWVEDALGGRIDYVYDQVGNLKQTIASGPDRATGVPGSITVTMGYDDLGRKISMSDPDKGDWEYGYNAFGELVWQRDAKGQRSEMDYDELGRMVTRRDFSFDTSIDGLVLEDTATWVYDSAVNGLGQLDTVTSSATGHTKSYAYDNFGRAYRVDHDLGVGIQGIYSTYTTFDEFGRTFQQFDAVGGNSGTQSVYNAQGYLWKVLDAREIRGQQQTLYEVTEVDQHKRVRSAILANGYTQGRYYNDQTGRLELIQTFNTLAEPIQDLEYEYDALGNLTHRYSRSGGANLEEGFCYDDLNRLTQVHKSGVECGGSDQITYDSFGNIETKDGVQYSYGNNAGPHAVTEAGGIQYRYDANGNMTSDDSGRSIEYTTFDKPDLMTKGSQTTVSFTYGVDRSRIKRTDIDQVKQATTLYMGNVEKVINDEDGSYQIKRYINKTTLWINHYDAAGNILNVDKQYMLRDHLGSVDIILDEDNNVLSALSFDAWGERRNTGAFDAQAGAWNYATADWANLPLTSALLFSDRFTNRGFTDHEHVDSMGLVHMNGRIYDPRLGRFLQADPFVQFPSNTQSYNRYSYVLNNPLRYTDPSGFLSFGDFFKSVVQTVMVVVVAPYCPPCAAAMAYGFAKMNGASSGQAFFAAAMAFIGGEMAQPGTSAGVSETTAMTAADEVSSATAANLTGEAVTAETVAASSGVTLEEILVTAPRINSTGVTIANAGTAAAMSGGSGGRTYDSLQTKEIGSYTLADGTPGQVYLCDSWCQMKGRLYDYADEIGMSAATMATMINGIDTATMVTNPARMGMKAGGKLLSSPRKHLMDTVTDPKLRGRIDKMYRRNASIGNGSTADAIRHEIKTGEALNTNVGHFKKGIEMRRGLIKDINSGRLNQIDRDIANMLKRDLEDAMTIK